MGAILIPVSMLMGLLAFMEQPEVLRAIFILSSLLTGLLVIRNLRFGLRLKRQAAWYISFQSGLVRINFRNYAATDTDLNPSDAIMEVSNDQILWIRQAKKIGYGDDSDSFFVDMRLTPETWAVAKGFRNSYWLSSDPITERGPGSGITFFYDDIMRIRLVKPLPDDVVQHWHLWNYPVSADYEVKQVMPFDQEGFSPK